MRCSALGARLCPCPCPAFPSSRRRRLAPAPAPASAAAAAASVAAVSAAGAGARPCPCWWRCHWRCLCPLLVTVPLGSAHSRARAPCPCSCPCRSLLAVIFAPHPPGLSADARLVPSNLLFWALTLFLHAPCIPPLHPLVMHVSPCHPFADSLRVHRPHVVLLITGARGVYGAQRPDCLEVYSKSNQKLIPMITLS